MVSRLRGVEFDWTEGATGLAFRKSSEVLLSLCVNEFLIVFLTFLGGGVVSPRRMTLCLTERLVSLHKKWRRYFPNWSIQLECACLMGSIDALWTTQS